MSNGFCAHSFLRETDTNNSHSRVFFKGTGRRFLKIQKICLSALLIDSGMYSYPHRELFDKDSLKFRKFVLQISDWEVMPNEEAIILTYTLNASPSFLNVPSFLSLEPGYIIPIQLGTQPPRTFCMTFQCSPLSTRSKDFSLSVSGFRYASQKAPFQNVLRIPLSNVSTNGAQGSSCFPARILKRFSA